MPLFFIPIGDDRDKKTIIPFVKYGLIAANIAVFLIFQLGEKGVEFTMAYSLVPKEIITGHDVQTPASSVLDPETDLYVVIPGLQKTPIPVWLTFATSMFMHAGLLHLIGNMIYLQMFGTAVEDEMGHSKFLIFYLFMGFGAALAHVVMNRTAPNSLVPCIGASGAIAGVMGGYLMHHPLRNVHIMVLRAVITLPAWGFIGMWFLLQIYGGLQPVAEEGGGGVAFAAHIGGLLLGFALAPAFSNPKAPPEYMTKQKVLELRDKLYEPQDAQGISTDYSQWKDQEWK